jgi:lysophospholipase L1-like esterase
VLLLAACGSGGATRSAQPSDQPPVLDAHVYAAIGASETVGVGAEHPERDAWTQVFYRTALPDSAVFFNFGEPGITVQQALDREVPSALAVRPDLVTVWLNTNDILHQVPVDAYQDQLDRLVQALRQGGRARVLLANTPVLDGLPSYRDCLQQPQGPRCLLRDQPVPQPAQLRALVAQYNAAIATVAGRRGAVLVDLNCQGDMAALHPDWLSSDGFHPNARGYAAIAAAFAGAARGERCPKPPR